MYQLFKLRLRLRREDKGVAAIEFALILPVLVLTFVGIFDISNLIFCYNKMNRTAQNMSNIVTRGEVTKPQLDAMLKASVSMAQPFVFTTANGANVIVTSVSKPSATLPSQVNWRDSYPGGTGGSKVSASSLPGGLVLNAGQTVIVTEVFYTYAPLIPGYVISTVNTQIYAVAAAAPRQGQMTTLPAN